MKVLHMGLAFLPTVTALADSAHPLIGSVHPLALFANLNNTFVPLSEFLYKGKYFEARILGYENSSADPVEFILQKDNIINSTSIQGFLTYTGYFLALETNNYAFPFDLDSEGKILPELFQSCEIANSTVHAIMVADKKTSRENCLGVEIYLLPYDKKNKSVLKLKDRSEKGPEERDESSKKTSTNTAAVASTSEPKSPSVDSSSSTSAKGKSKPSAVNNSKCSPCMASKSSTSTGESTITKRITSTATICNECKTASSITVLKTYTNYTTYCPEKTTLNITVCKKVCHPTTVTVTSATTLTIPGVCIIPETIAAGAKGLDKPTSTSKAPKKTAKARKTPTKPGMTTIAPEKKSGSGSGKKINPDRPKPSTREKDVTKTRTATITAPRFSSFVNGASKNALGACAMGLAALLL